MTKIQKFNLGIAFVGNDMTGNKKGKEKYHFIFKSQKQMNNISYLTIEFDQFKNSINALASNGHLLAKREVKTEADYEELEIDKREWEKEVTAVFSESFSDGENTFLTSFRQVPTAKNFHITGIGEQRPLYKRVEDAKNHISAKVGNAQDAILQISQCEYIIAGAKFDLASRAKFTMKQKLALLLEKLYELNDGRYYDIQLLLRGNGIFSKNYNEPRELSMMLQDNGLIQILGALGGVSAKITPLGCMKVEEGLEATQENYNDIPNPNVLKERIDEVVQQLRTQGIGQEILFNELQELKEQIGNLNKKNWSQLLKGKIVDLALGKLVENDTLKVIYEQVTGHELKLIG